MSRKPKYPHLKELFHQDRNAYMREWRKLNPDKNFIKINIPYEDLLQMKSKLTTTSNIGKTSGKG